MKKESAAAVIKLLHAASSKLNTSIKVVQREESQEEFERYREAVGTVMGKLAFSLLFPLYRKYPSLAPPEEFKMRSTRKRAEKAARPSQKRRQS